MAVRTSRFNFQNLKNIVSKQNPVPFAKTTYRRAVYQVDRRPLTSFFVALGILLLVIATANFFKPKQETIQKQAVVKTVSVYKIGEVPKVQIQAKVEKSGVITIAALSGGVVSTINVKEGDSVVKGTNLIQLSSNYQGGNAPAIQAQLASAQYKNVVDTFDLQKDTIAKQRAVADQTKENADDLREIAQQSRDDTQSLVDLNNNILSLINTDLAQYEATNSAGTNTQLIFQTRQLKAQYQSAVNQLNASLRNLKLQADKEEPQSELAGLQREITHKQLELQEKALELTRETSLFQLRLAQVNADLMHPVSPVGGVVQRVMVRAGQSVSSGAPLFTIAASTGEIKATAFVPYQLASQVSKLEPSVLTLQNKTVEAVPLFVSTEATSGSLYSIVYIIPGEFKSLVLEGGYIPISVPIGYPNTSGAVPFIPLDAITVTQDESYVFVAQNGQAESRSVQLGSVYGRFVEITSGLSSGDQVILNRNVVNGDKVASQ